VYNVPKYQAIDVIDGRKYKFIGDPILLNDGFSRNFHLQPSRVLHRVKPESNTGNLSSKMFKFYNKRILIIDSTILFNNNSQKPIDVIVLSKNPKIYIPKLIEAFDIKQIVADGSVPIWKVKLWKRDADSLSIPFHDVTQSGAFVMEM
jgi:competence protein ComEC